MKSGVAVAIPKHHEFAFDMHFLQSTAVCEDARLRFRQKRRFSRCQSTLMKATMPPR